MNFLASLLGIVRSHHPPSLLPLNHPKFNVAASDDDDDEASATSSTALVSADEEPQITKALLPTCMSTMV